ncbi:MULTISPECIES: hypothetical protein [Microbacterium]|uniref:hypothetical protein n=1 Tax=Microbacterium TaxID=33882 RepID=UPI00217CD786|nr:MULTISPECIES: hypothetical protein [Microbacterium]UWF77603.1 hypothetical protein JSY13_00465 [Microbacterium neungamense]WCM55774.1 hypothetical protein JRG78_00480 [Microbacterium sp. EF45047]
MKSSADKTVAVIALLTLLGLGTAACSGDATPSAQKPASQSSADSGSPEAKTEKPEPVDLTGEWKQTNANSEESFQTATITGSTIEVYWNGPDMSALYWAGTVDVPRDGSTTFTWDSVNDKSKTNTSIMASSDDTKTFTYTEGEISYNVTALDATVTVRLAKQ